MLLALVFKETTRSPSFMFSKLFYANHNMLMMDTYVEENIVESDTSDSNS